MPNHLVSVIIPVYNVQDYLVRCVDSILNQSYRNMEIILVDDGSMDSSPIICDELAKKDDRITVLHQSNGGVSLARNAGIDIAKGDFIAFVDSDDWVQPDMIEVMISRFSDGVDIVRCAYRKYFDEKNTVDVTDGKETILDSQDYLNLMFSDEALNSNCWCKMYRKSVIGGVKFPVSYKVGEDNYFNYQVVKNANKICISSKIVYNYFINKDSATNGIGSTEGWLQNIKLHSEIFDDESENPKICDTIALAFSSWLLDFYSVMIKNNDLKTEYFDESNQILDKYFKTLMKTNLSQKIKVKLVLAKYFRPLYIRMLKFVVSK